MAIKPKRKSFAKLLKDEYGVTYGEGEIKRFTPQIKEAIRIVTEGHIKHDTTKRKLTALGFKIETSSGVACIGDKQVLKLCYVCNADDLSKDPPLYIRVPTVRLTNKGSYHLMVQPKADIPRNKVQLIKDVRETLKKHKKKHIFDIHSGNVGVYRKKTVLFDW